MPISLYPHNAEAYASALAMLAETGKAAIVHPTGTGKSFIGFKLCEEHPDKTVLWLSPSEYIFKTQLENLKAAGGDEPQNIRFYTYAKLMNMSEEEMGEIEPSFVVFDEYHRAGASQWQLGVQRLLNLYPDVPILGLTATAIRYLDNQRDMSDELFDGNVASEMTLGEAIVRGILNPPKYVLSVYSYQKDLEKYERRVRAARNKAVRDAAEKYLEALRRALEKADGLDVIFDKHMTDRTGKYIVFCANYEHLCEMTEKAPEWFAKVDTAPHIYTAYSDDPETSKAFDDFKKDNSDHLKLLFCIDMLNEGIHVDGVSGVILLRPTVSPIIYKQQIGRALSASKKKDAVIFDVVMNIENLYSIGAIEEEMEIAAVYYRSLGEDEAIVNERFQIIDELRECQALFEKLEDTLFASWDVMYSCAARYYREYGNLEVPARYRTEEGYALGRWIFNQKGIRKGQMEGTLTEEQIAKLDAIGMVWGYYNDLNWEKNFAAAEAYYKENGNLDVPARYRTKDGIALGMWLCSLRTWERAGVHPKYLTEERKAKLETVGMIWDKLDFYWERNYLAACAYYREHRNLEVPVKYVTEDGVRLGSWIARLRSLRAGRVKRGTPPTPEQIARLDAIGMVWESNVDSKWERGYAAARRYAETFGNLNVPDGYKTETGFVLKSWLQNQRKRYREGKLESERKERLDRIGMVWESGRGWFDRYEMVKQYYAKNGTVNIPQTYVENGVWLGKWLCAQKKYYRSNTVLTEEQRQLIAKLPLEQVGMQKDNWSEIFEDAKEYKESHGSFEGIPKTYKGKSGYLLSNWVFTQKRKYRRGELSEHQIQMLDGIGFPWTAPSAWDRGYRYAKAYYQEHGNLLMKQSYKADDGYGLGVWVYQCRLAYHSDKGNGLTQEQIRMLDEIGMVWQLESTKYLSSKAENKATKKVLPKTAREKKSPAQPPNPWDVSFANAKAYYEKHGSVVDIKPRDEKEKKLANWLHAQRKFYRLGYLVPSQIEQLASIGVTEKWLMPQPTPFEKGYIKAVAYYKKHGNLNFGTNAQTDDGFWIGAWADKIRKKRDTLTSEQIQKLDAIGFVWEPADPWEEQFQKAEAYYQKHGELPLEPKQCKNAEERHLCQWLRRQLLRKNDGKMPKEQIDRLSAVGMDWLNTNERLWERGFSRAKAYREANGNLDVIVSYVCEDGYPLGEWLHSQRTHKNKMPQEKRQALIAMGARGMD